MVYSISDLAIEAGISYHTLYYYIREGLIRESTLVGNRQRIFDESDLDKLKRIIYLRKEGKSIEYIRGILEEGADVHTKHL
ncbi:MerR family transcriptional regulator [Candidatus Gottesmanbacteria bacterium]|nr:MerR family transcriptional regulator [Candidatus Gottesmanbacteria bacterium]